MKKTLVALLALCLTASVSLAQQEVTKPDSAKGMKNECCMKGKDATASMECCKEGKDGKASMECSMKGKAAVHGAECKEMKDAKSAGEGKSCCPEGKKEMKEMKGKAKAPGTKGS